MMNNDYSRGSSLSSLSSSSSFNNNKMNMNEEISKLENGMKSLLKDLNQLKSQVFSISNNTNNGNINGHYHHHSNNNGIGGGVHHLCNNCKQQISTMTMTTVSPSISTISPSSSMTSIVSNNNNNNNNKTFLNSSTPPSTITSPSLLEQQDILSLTSINGSPILSSSGKAHSSLILGSSRMSRSNSNSNVPKLQLKQFRSQSTCYHDNTLIKKWIDETVVNKDKPIPSSISSTSLSSIVGGAGAINSNHSTSPAGMGLSSSVSSSTTSFSSSNSSKKIKLDVGGKYFSTTVSTLTKHADSMLGAMFSSRFELPVDDDGRIFIDRDEYSPTLNNWSIRAPILDSMLSTFYMVSVVVGDSIYAIPDAGLHQPVFRYDQADEKWHTTETALPTKRTSFAMTVVDDYIYVMGGYKGSSPTDIVERYHPKSNSWCSVASMSSKRAEFSAAVIDDHIYAIGGSIPNSTVEKFNPHANQWTLVCNLANSNSKFTVSSSAVLNAKIYAIGSENECEDLNIVLQYTPETNQWRRVAPILGNSYYTNSALVIDRFIYFVPWNSLNVNRYESCLEIEED
ncbi:Kelch repeat-containing protein [Cavenderia fasciculata]|uniref:Kelch repeat-containing protein n=1 Tax=Cavenderia fasciculata TaxID=261658 RepID=F4PSC6_CACFS|nr:Kelch repeat-containing protein [Cavenderia fasciculata]EGG20672.1 Kelch repeat-containing protein [Cavenderia fasciculata]|eukprot:XP_004358522.1 Kelch repeat-containing protein [Cavenderia fasciculata]